MLKRRKKVVGNHLYRVVQDRDYLEEDTGDLWPTMEAENWRKEEKRENVFFACDARDSKLKTSNAYKINIRGKSIVIEFGNVIFNVCKLIIM